MDLLHNGSEEGERRLTNVATHGLDHKTWRPKPQVIEAFMRANDHEL